MSEDPVGLPGTSRTWAVDLEAASRRQLGQARWFAAGAALIAILEAFALLLLLPLKTVVPIPVLVDRQTGFTQVLMSDGAQALHADVALTRSLLAQYVSARESFDLMTVRLDYHKVVLWSQGVARDSYVAEMPASNPASPFRRYPRATIVETLVKSVSPSGPRAAFVRFATRTRDQNGSTSPPRSWIALVVYKFSNEPLTAADRLMNPLGFQVLRYRKDPETLLEKDVDPAPPLDTGLAAAAATSPSASQPAVEAPRR